MEFTGRRIVTGHDAEGRDVILSDGPPPGVIDPAETSGGFGLAHWLWLDGAAAHRRRRWRGARRSPSSSNRHPVVAR